MQQTGPQSSAISIGQKRKTSVKTYLLNLLTFQKPTTNIATHCPAGGAKYQLKWLRDTVPVPPNNIRACTIDEEMYDFITKKPTTFTGVEYPKPIFLSYYNDEKMSLPPWLHYRDTKGRFIKKDLAMDLFNLRTVVKPREEHQQQAFMVEGKIYLVSDRH